jgi:hypothetical protein
MKMSNLSNINVSDIVHDPDYEGDIFIERTHNGHYVKSQYVTDPPEVLTLHGYSFHPQNSKEINQTEEGDQATGSIEIILDGDTQLYTTRKRLDNHNNISDRIIENYGTDYPTYYKIIGIKNLADYGYMGATGTRVGAI